MAARQTDGLPPSAYAKAPPPLHPEKVPLTEASGGSEDVVALKPRISLFGGVMIIVGCIVGSGIFISPKGVHQNAGSVGLSLIIWVVCGIYSAIGAFCYAELGTFIRSSGGDYAYVMVAFGPFLGFLRMWSESIIIRPCTITTMAVTFATYALRPFFAYCDFPQYSTQLLAGGCITVLGFVNVLTMRGVILVQNVFTVGKLLALGLIIGTGVILVFSGGSHHDSFEDIWEGSQFSGGQLSLAFYSGLWAYSCWNYLNFITEELENPVRNLPIAIGISLSLVTVVYVLTNLAFYAGVSPEELLESSAVAVTFGNRFYGIFASIMPICVAMSCFGSVNGVLLTSSRLFYVAGRENHMPRVLSMINPYRETPLPAVVFTMFLGLFYLLLSDNVYTLINYVQIVSWLAFGLTTAGLLYLRYTQPPSQYPRPLQVHLIWPIIFLIGCVFLIVFPIIQAPVDTGIGIIIFLTGIPVYLAFIKYKLLGSSLDGVTVAMQKLLLIVPGHKIED